jgi:hypothetical protein
MVGEPLVVAAQQGQVDRGLDAVLEVLRQQLLEQRRVQLVDGVVVGQQLGGQGQVTGSGWRPGPSPG